MSSSSPLVEQAEVAAAVAGVEISMFLQSLSPSISTPTLWPSGCRSAPTFSYSAPWGNTVPASSLHQSQPPSPSAANTGATQSPSPFSPIPTTQSRRVPVWAQVRDLVLCYCLTKGLQGSVYLATRLGASEDKFLAVKVIKKDVVCENSLPFILHESRLLRVIPPHPFILQLDEAFHDSLSFYLVSDFHCGGDLYELITQCGAMSRTEARFYAAEMLLGIRYLHENYILHRDIKPANILIKGNGHICIADFGLSLNLLTQGTMDVNGNLVTRGYAGTLKYMCPEMHHDLNYGFGADWWGYGVTVYWLLQARVPWDDCDPKNIPYKICCNWLMYRPDVPLGHETRRFLEGVLQKNLYARLSVSEMKNHEFFTNLEFDKLLEENTPPPGHGWNKASDLAAYGLDEEFEYGVPYAEDDPYPDYNYSRLSSPTPNSSQLSSGAQHQDNSPSLGLPSSANEMVSENKEHLTWPFIGYYCSSS